MQHNSIDGSICMIQVGNMADYKLALHCGGCLIDQQKVISRVNDLSDFGIPFSNYGMLLAYLEQPRVLNRCLAPWGLAFEE